VICDWHYQPKPDPRTVDFLLDEGFTVVGCPAASCYGLLAHPRQANLDNLRDFARIAAARQSRGVLGMINTVWCPWRYFTGTTLFGIAFGAVCQQTGGVVPEDFPADFAAETFGLPVQAARKAGAALAALHAALPHANDLGAAFPQRMAEIAAIDAARSAQLSGIAQEAQQAFGVLEAQHARVRRFGHYYDEIVFTARALGEAAHRAVLLRQMLDQRRRSGTGKAAQAWLAREAAEAKALHRAALRLWDRQRYADDPMRAAGAKAGFDFFVQRLESTAKLVGTMACRRTKARAKPARQRTRNS